MYHFDVISKYNISIHRYNSSVYLSSIFYEKIVDKYGTWQGQECRFNISFPPGTPKTFTW